MRVCARRYVFVLLRLFPSQLSRSHWVDQEDCKERPMVADSVTTHTHRPMSSRHRDRPDTGKVHRSNLPMEPAREQFQHAVPAM